jgi:hypothetical protein
MFLVAIGFSGFTVMASKERTSPAARTYSINNYDLRCQWAAVNMQYLNDICQCGAFV